MSRTVQVERESTEVLERERDSNREFEVTKLETIEWNFSSAKTSYSTHGLHPYPAKYIPQIPHALVEELSHKGEVVADIFCGSGTTLVEALLLERSAVGIDANPLACLISEAKTTRLSQGDFELLLGTSERALRLANQISDPHGTPLFNPDAFVSTAYRPSSDAVSFWFDPFVVEELAEILSWCHTLPTTTSRNVALVAFSSIVVTVSKQDSDTRYVRREKKLKVGDVLRRFARSLSDAARRVDEFTRQVNPALSCRIINTDLLTQPDIGTVDLVVCSPPYPNAYSYHLYHMTRMVWLGMDQPKFKREEIGSHRKYSRKGPNGANVDTFRSEMATIFSWLRRHLRPNRYACFVVGDSTLKGETINNAELISEVAALEGFHEVSRIERRMQDTKKAFNPVIGKIKHEQIVVMKNIGGVSE